MRRVKGINKYYKIIAIGLGSIFLCLILLTLLFPYIITSAKVERYIAFKLSNFLQTEVRLQNIWLSIWLPLRVEIEGIEIKDRGLQAEDFIQVKNLYLKLNPLSLIWGQISLEELKLEGLTLNIHDIKSNRIITAPLDNRLARRFYPFSLKIKHLLVQESQVILRDQPFTPPHSDLTFINVGLTAQDISFKHSFPFKLEAQFKSAKVAVQGKILPPTSYHKGSRYRLNSKFWIDSLSLPQFNYLLTDQKVLGIISLSGDYRGELFGPFTSSLQISFSPLGIDIPQIFRRAIYWPKGNISLNLNYNNGRLVLENISFKTGRCSLKGYCRLENQQLIARINSDSPLMINSIKDYLPKKGFPEPISRYIQQKMLKGKIDSFTLEIEGKMKELTNPEMISRNNLIKAQARLSEVELLFDDHFHSVEEVKGIVSFRQGRMIFSELRGRYQNSDPLEGYGQIDNLLKVPVLSLYIQGSIRVEDLAADFASDESAPPFLYILGKEGNFKGLAWLELNISRILRDKLPLNLSGRLVLQENSIFYSPLRLPIKKLQGEIDFTQEIVKTQALRGEWGNSPFLLIGNLNEYKGKNPSVKMQIFTELNISEVKNLFPSSFLKDVIYQGNPHLQLNIQRRANHWLIASIIDLTDMGYQYKGLMKNKGIPNRISCQLQLGAKRIWKIDSFKLELTDMEVSGQGEIIPRDQGSPYWQIVMKSNQFEASKLWSLIQTENLLAKDELIQGKLGFDVRWLSSSPPEIKFNLKGNYIDLEKFFSSLEAKEGGKFNWKDFLSGKILEGEIVTQKGMLPGGISFSNLRANLLSRQEEIEVQGLELEIQEGHFKGQSIIKIGPSSKPGYQLSGSARKIKLGNLIRELNNNNTALDGSLNFALDLETQGSSSITEIASLNGNISIKLKRGVLRKYSLVSKIFSLLNISQLLELQLPDLFTKGMPYKEIVGDFKIKNGIAHTDNLFLSSRSLNMAAVGEIDLIKKALDLTIAVQPFQTVDKVVALVPVLGYILTDENNSLILALFKVEGSWDDPSVTPIPFTSIQKGLLGIFKRLLLLPKDIFTGDKNPWEILLPKLP
jgi:uncharacterized protein YhdP